MAPLNGLKNRLRQERGAELIEMALVLPLLLLIIMGIIDFGFMFREMNVVTNAAREGARTGILPDYDDADIDARVQQYMNAAGIGVSCPSASCVVLKPVVSVTAPSGPFQARDVRVTIFHDWTFMSPFAAMFGGSFSSVALSGRAVMRVE
jgi:Flp pilus assembly protein TadG